MLKLLFRIFLKLLFVFAVVFAVLVLANLYTYKHLIDEKPIAQLTFNQINTQEYDATIRLGNFCDSNVYKVYGDEWRIDAQFLKWKSWVNLFGIDALYRIERLSGRYTDIQDENSKQHIAHDLKPITTLDLSKIAEQYNEKFDLVDTKYGSSVYEKMRTNTVFIVFRTQSGLLVREQESKSDDFQNTNKCTNDHSVWKNSIIRLDQGLATLLMALQIKSPVTP